MTRSSLAPIVAAATLVVAATGVLASTSAPAAAAGCESGSGVTVVVDPGALGDSLTTCDGGAGQPASDRFADVGVVLIYAQRQPGFVCRVNDAPASEPCINAAPADAYWGLFWSDGRTATWTYSSIGVTGLDVPEGGAVALAWQQGSTRRSPAVAPPVHSEPTPTPATPTPTPKTKPTQTPRPTRSGSTAPTATPPAPTQPTSAPAAPTQSASPSTAGTEAATEQSSAAASRTPSPGAKASSAAADPAEGGSASSAPASTSTDPVIDPVASAAETESRRVPTWVSLGILVLLLVSIGISAMAARRRTRP